MDFMHFWLFYLRFFFFFYPFPPHPMPSPSFVLFITFAPFCAILPAWGSFLAKSDPISRYDFTPYPNPKSFDGPNSEGYRRCRVSRSGTLCDPEALISSSDRDELAEMLEEFPSLTKNHFGKTPCERKGVTVGIALSKWKISLKENAKMDQNRKIGERFAEHWMLDKECQKMVMILYWTNPRKSVTVWHKNVPIREKELTDFLEKRHFEGRSHFFVLKSLVNWLNRTIVSRRQQQQQLDFFSSRHLANSASNPLLANHSLPLHARSYASSSASSPTILLLTLSLFCFSKVGSYIGIVTDP